MNVVELNKESITTLCVQHHVEKLYSFGSIGTSLFTSESDIDLLVTFENMDLSQYFDNYVNMKKGLETLLNRKVDLVEEQTIKNPILRRSIDRGKSLYMDEYIEKWLYDILSAIREIEVFFASNEKTFESFSNNTILKRAIERDLEIIGEAVNRILTRDQSVFIETQEKLLILEIILFIGTMIFPMRLFDLSLQIIFLF